MFTFLCSWFSFVNDERTNHHFLSQGLKLFDMLVVDVYFDNIPLTSVVIDYDFSFISLLAFFHIGVIIIPI